MKIKDFGILDDLIWTFKLYSLTVIPPAVLSIMNILLLILGIKTKISFLMLFKIIWIDYYFTGSFLGTSALRIHLGLLFISFLIILSSRNNR